MSQHEHEYVLTVDKQSTTGYKQLAECSCGHKVNVLISTPSRKDYHRAYRARKKKELEDLKEEVKTLRQSNKRKRSIPDSPPSPIPPGKITLGYSYRCNRY